MIVFNQEDGWTSKVNFVDENNVFLGYDLTQQCCEYADWFIADQPTEKIQLRCSQWREGLPELADWVFDPTYFRELDDVDMSEINADNHGSERDCNHMVIFRLVHGEQEKFLHLFNCQNGYYIHGFEFTVNEKLEREGIL